MLMDRKIYTIFVAGGSGTRMGADMPKQFLPLGGKPILQRTIENFTDAVPGMHVVTVLPKRHFDTWKEMCMVNEMNCPQIIVEGGMTRFHSVRNALARIPDGAIVAVQDGVRPLASKELIAAMFRKAAEVPALIPVIPVVDTLRSKVAGEPAPDRSRLVAVQTPQIFWSEVLKDAYEQAYDESFTDDASVVEKKKIPLSFMDGERFNIKITTPEDLVLGEAILSFPK